MVAGKFRDALDLTRISRQQAIPTGDPSAVSAACWREIQAQFGT